MMKPQHWPATTFRWEDFADGGRICRPVNTDVSDTLGGGLVELRASRIPWTVRYDELLYVIDGHLSLEANDRSFEAHSGDLIWLPEGTAIVYGTPSWTRFLWVLYPADWALRSKDVPS
ncbi:MAG: cupin domain-containing protein [Bacilli bacterium]